MSEYGDLIGDLSAQQPAHAYGKYRALVVDNLDPYRPIWDGLLH